MAAHIYKDVENLQKLVMVLQEANVNSTIKIAQLEITVTALKIKQLAAADPPNSSSTPLPHTATRPFSTPPP